MPDERVILDFGKLDAGMLGYIDELRQQIKKARAERDEWKAKVEAKPAAPAVRGLSRREYQKAKAEALRNLGRQEQERRNALVSTNLAGVDVRKMDRDEYRQLEKKLARRG